MGIEGISKSEVSRMAKELDKVVAEFKERPLDKGPYRCLWIDALTQRVREGDPVVNVSAVIATAVNVEGRREIVGLDIATTEDTGRLDGVPAGPGGSGTEWRRAGDLRRSRRYQGRYREGLRRSVLATLPNPLRDVRVMPTAQRSASSVVVNAFRRSA